MSEWDDLVDQFWGYIPPDKAYAQRLGPLKYEIRRKRTKDDPPALVDYVILSGVFTTPEAAWKDAAKKNGQTQDSGLPSG